MQSFTKNHRNLLIAMAWMFVALCATSGCVMDELDSEPIHAETLALSTTPGAHVHWRVTSNYKDRNLLISHLDSLDASNTDIDAMATTPDGEWILVANDTNIYSSGFPFSVVFYSAVLMSSGETVRAIDFNADGGWVVVGDTRYFTDGPVPATAINAIEWYLYTKGWAIRDVDITTSGYVVVGPGTAVSYSGVDADLGKVLYDRHASRRSVNQIEIGFDGRWAVISDQEPATENMSSTLATVLHNMAEGEWSASRLMLGVGDNFVAYSHGKVAHDTSNPMEMIEYELITATGRKNIWQRMEEAGIPGVSIAIVDGNQIAYARSYGVLKAGEQAPVLATTPFDLASLSKYLGALVVVRLQELGWITSLDQDILDFPGSTVSAWAQIGSNPFQSTSYFGSAGAALPQGMTLRQIMSHRAAIRAEGGSPGAPSERWANLAGVSTLAWLLGYECSSSSQPCGYFQNKYVWTDPNLSVGGSPTYASGNFLLAQAIAEDNTWGTPGADLLDDFLLEPLGMSNSSGQAPLPTSLEARAAWQHDSNGPRASRTVYPWTFAGGVYASASDYARALILALDQGRDASGVQRIGATQIAELLTGAFGRGLGVRLEGGTNSGEGTDRAFFHSGGHGGRARTWMCGNPTRDEGIVILINADTPGVSAFLGEVLDAFTDSMGWPSTLNCR